MLDIHSLTSIHGVPEEERETHISIIEGKMLVYTSDNKFLTKIKRVAAKNPEIKCVAEGRNKAKGYVTFYEFEFPVSCLSLRHGRKIKRNLTDEQKKVAAERFKNTRRKEKSE